MTSKKPYQITLFDTVSQVYAEAGDSSVSQSELYASVKEKMKLCDEDVEARGSVHDGRTFNIFHRDCRWAQQRLKSKGYLTRVDQGLWRLTEAGKEHLTEIEDGFSCIAFSTELGVALWGDAKHVGNEVIDDQINLILTSPPYPNICRNYGTIRSESKYIDFILENIEPYVSRLAPGAGVVLNVGNDVFEKGIPARSVYIERLVLAIHDSLNLHLVERIIWQANKCPGPTQWAFVNRYMLRSGFEFSFCFTNTPESLQWDNRNILEDHNEEYLRWCQNGGQKHSWSNNSYYKKAGAFSGTTSKRSKIPSNVVSFGNSCREGLKVKKYARAHGLSEHTATFPKLFAEFFIKWMTDTGDLVVDPFGGTLTTGSAAESLGRRWLSTDKFLDFLQMGSVRFSDAKLNENIQWPHLRAAQ